MDLNQYALEQIVAARLAETREWRQRMALASALRAERTAAVRASGADTHRARRFVRWLLNVPADTPRGSQGEARPARLGAGR
jgi:hypothetical protein